MDDVLFAEGYSASGSGYEPNDTLATAATLTEGTHTIAGTNVDWYRLNSLSGTISVTMTPGDATNLNMVLYNSAGEAVSADFQPTGPETVSYLAPADGTYYLKVFTAQFVDNPPPGTALNYALSVDMPEPTVRGPNDPGESLATATTITEGLRSVTGTGFDWFRFTTLSGTITVTMTPGTASDNYNLVLYNHLGQALAVSPTASGAETISFLAPADGTYYLQVLNAAYPNGTPNGVTLDYTLDLDLPAATVRGANDPGETLTTATVITQGTHQVTGTGLDWFTFDTQPGMMHFTLAGANGDNLNLELYNAAGEVVAANISATGNESFSFLAPDAGTYYLRVLNAAYPNGTPNGVTMTYALTVDLPDTSWAVALDFGPVRDASVAVYDIDNDGQEEIFIGTSKALDAQGNEVRPAGLIVLEPDGTVKWTHTFAAADGIDPKTGKSYNTTSVSTAPTFSDVDGDGRIDIVVGLGGDNRSEFDSVGQPGDRGGVAALDADGNLIWFFETRDTFGDDNRADGVYSSPTVFDIDADGVREVIFQSWDHRLYMLDGRTGEMERDTDLHDTAGATPGLADLDGDGLYEIISPSDVTDNPLAGLGTQGGVLHVFDNYGLPSVAGWQTQVDQSTSADYRGQFDEQSLWASPQMVDLDGDGTLEIVQGTGNFFQDSRGEHIKVWNADGTLRMTLTARGQVYAAPLIADLNGDGRMEIVAGTLDGYVQAWNASGQAVFSTHVVPYGTTAASFLPVTRNPIAVDIDNADGDLEILVSMGPQMVILDSNGTQITSQTRGELVYRTYDGSPVARDIDGDGRLDLISGGTNSDHDQAIIYRFENLTDTVADSYRTASYQGNQSLHNIQSFVDRFYSTILGRSADAAGGNLWTDLLYSGVRTGADVARGFINSAEFVSRGTSNEEYVDVLYAAFFGRAASADEASAWAKLMEAGRSRDQVMNGFIYSQEFANLASAYGIRPQGATGAGSNAAVITGDPNDVSILRGGAGNQTLYDGASVTETNPSEYAFFGQVYRLYGATLGRTPDAGGLKGWVEALGQGRIVLDQTAGAFVGSQEFQNVYGSLSDAQFVTLLYNNVLGRAPSQGEVNAWMANIAAGNSREGVVLGFSESAEYQRNSNEGLDAFMRDIETTWLDVIEGGAGNDTMNGGHGGDTYVFRAGQGGIDVIHGFEPWDILQLSGFGFTSGADAMAHMVQEGPDVVFNYSGQVIRFTNTVLADMNRVSYNVS